MSATFPNPINRPAALDEAAEVGLKDEALPAFNLRFPDLTPESLGELFTAYMDRPVGAEGNEQLHSYFTRPFGLFVCQGLKTQASFERVWIIDADDTLWPDNRHFEELIAELTSLAIEKGVPLSPKEIREIVNECEHEVIPQMGMGAHGFYVSMCNTWRRLQEVHPSLGDHPAALYDRIVPYLSGVPYELTPGAEELLTALRADPRNAIVLFTHGPMDVQIQKIVNSGLAPRFHAIGVASNKKDEMYSRLIEQLGFTGLEYVVIGNSMNSDVAPAVRLGLRAVHFDNPESWASVNTCRPDPGAYAVVNNLLDLLRLRW